MTERAHGTLAKHKVEGCTCQPCRDAFNDWRRNRTRQQAYGRWQPYVDAQPVREHVGKLIAAGINWRRVAELAVVSTGVVEKLLYGQPRAGKAPSKRMRPEAARKLLALQAGPDKVLTVDAIGYQRRIQALARNGWSLHRLAEELGTDKGTLNRTLGRRRIHAHTEQAGRALYDRLWRLDPTEHGISANAASIARGWAVRRGWATVGCWDDDTIDDPSTFPNWTGKCGTPQGYWAHYEHGLKPVCEPCRAARSAHERKTPAAA